MSYRAPLFAVLAVLALAVGWWYLLYQPQLDERAELEAQSAELDRQEAQLRTQIAELERVRDNEMAIRAELSLLEEYIPSGVAQPTALRELQEAADAAGVDIQTLAFGAPVAVPDSPDTGEPSTTLAQIAVSMTVDAGYFQLVDLLRRLEVEVPRAVLVERMTVSEGSGDGFPTLSANWSGRLFAVVDVASTVDPADGAPPGPDDEGDEGDDDGDSDDLEGGSAEADRDEEGATS